MRNENEMNYLACLVGKQSSIMTSQQVLREGLREERAELMHEGPWTGLTLGVRTDACGQH